MATLGSHCSHFTRHCNHLGSPIGHEILAVGNCRSYSLNVGLFDLRILSAGGGFIHGTSVLSGHAIHPRTPLPSHSRAPTSTLTISCSHANKISLTLVKQLLNYDITRTRRELNSLVIHSPIASEVRDTRTCLSNSVNRGLSTVRSVRGGVRDSQVSTKRDS